MDKERVRRYWEQVRKNAEPALRRPAWMNSGVDLNPRNFDVPEREPLNGA